LKIFSPWPTTIAAVAIVGLHIPIGWAETAPSFPELMRQAEATAPRMLESVATVAAARGRARQAAAFPNPSVGLELEDFAGTNTYRGTGHSQLTVSLSEPLEIGGQRGARKAVGRAELDAAQARGSQARAEFGYDLAIAYVMAEAAHERLLLLSDDVLRAQEDLRAARALVEAGKEGELRSVQAEAAAAAASAELETARADESAALNALSSLAGVTTPYTAVQSSLLKVLAHQANAQVPTSSAPSVIAAQAEREAADRRVALERKQAIPTPSLMIGTRRIEGDNSTAWVAGVSVPLPIFDRNVGAIDAARAELAAAEARLTAAKLDAAAEWQTAAVQDKAARAKLTAAEQSEGAAREAYRLARIGYEAGRTPLYELLSTRRAFTDAQLRLLDARIAGVRARASLARLAGRIPFVE